MPLLGSEGLKKIRSGQMTFGMGIYHLRGAPASLLAKAAGYDWLFIDCEHGAMSTQEASHISIAALPTGIVPIVRICKGAIDEGTRALDNGALGLVIPHIDTAEEARALVDAFRFPPMGHRSSGGPSAQFGYRPPGSIAMQSALNDELLIVVMIESPQAVENADAIAAVKGIDVLLIGTNDLSAEMGVVGQLGHERVHAAYKTVADACKRHNKVLGMGGVYDQELAPRYIGLGARFILAAGDHSLLLEAASKRTEFLRGLAPS
jgi:2-keto-3-deoxy-L-rhamnonate aldolase RhmA